MKKIIFNATKCRSCGGCAALCKSKALEIPRLKLKFYPKKCTLCMNCILVCPINSFAIK